MATTATEDLVVRTKAGELRGARENGIAVFRGVPYAAAPVGELRFAPPQPVPAWQGVRDATKDGPIAPQGRSRLAHVMGDFERPQSEDCLTLNIWTPAPDSKKRPVLVWIHGGAFASGAGSLPWYSGERFAANGDVVVVSINYRLGALGFLCLPGVSDGNLGLLDQVAALRFVRDNIAAFGGDPDNVTVVGQSAGAASIAILMTMPQADGLFRRAILQSTPFGRMSRTLEDSHRIGRRLLEVLGLKPDEAGQLKSLPFARFVTAQGEVARLEKKFADALAPFWPVIDGKVYPGEVAPALKAGAGAEIDTMIGTTREEMAAFYCIDQEVANADAAAVEGVFASMFKSDHRPYYDEIRRMRASGTNAALLGDLMSDAMFRIGSLRMAECAGRPGTAGLCVPVRLAIAGRVRVLSLPRDSVRVQQFRELDGLADAQGRQARGDQGACGGDARRLDRIRAHRKARSPALAGVAALPARGPHDHALRQRDRAGQRSRRAGMAPALAR